MTKHARRFVRLDDGERVMAVKRGKAYGFLCAFTHSCSGCCETQDGYNVNGYRFDEKAHCLIGSGCSECGYTGKRRSVYWLYLPKEIQRTLMEVA